MRVCSLSYAICIAHAPYYIVICGLSGSTIFFPSSSHKRHDFRKKKKLLNKKTCVLICSTTFVWKTSHSELNLARYYHKCTLGLMQSSRYLSQFVKTHDFSRHIFEKPSNIKLHENPSSGSCIGPQGQVGMAKITVAFCSSANASNKRKDYIWHVFSTVSPSKTLAFKSQLQPRTKESSVS